jgi:hypothetical protein
MTSLQLSKKAPPDWGLHLELATLVDRRVTSTENAQGEQPRRQPRPQPGPSPLCKGNHWRSKCPCLQMEGEVPPPMDWWVLASCPCSTSWHPCWGAIMAEKQKIIFWLDSGARFSVLPFSPGPRSNDKVIIGGKSGQPLEHYFYLACGLLLGRPPLLSLFPHST